MGNPEHIASVLKRVIDDLPKAHKESIHEVERIFPGTLIWDAYKKIWRRISLPEDKGHVIKRERRE